MDKLISWMISAIIVMAIMFWLNPDLMGSSRDDTDRISQAFQAKKSNIVVEVGGEVAANLPDIEDNAVYQQFILQLNSNHLVIVSHNTDLSPPVPVGPGSHVRVRGEYDWTPEGGLIHWTHSDPSGVREGGWIETHGDRYD